jgi:L-fucose mutarotase/ribose pyranase (RbsD/FucU family)
MKIAIIGDQDKCLSTDIKKLAKEMAKGEDVVIVDKDEPHDQAIFIFENVKRTPIEILQPKRQKKNWQPRSY